MKRYFAVGGPDVEIVQLGYVGFGVKDLAAWEDVAENVVGLRVSERVEGRTTYLRMDDYHHRIALHPTGEDDIVYMGWQVAGPDALAAVADRVRASGIDVSEGTPDEIKDRRAKAMLHFRDPSGYRYEIFYGPIESIVPFVPGRPMAGFKAGPQGLGHVVLRVDDRDDTEAFLTRTLGLRLTDYGSGRLAFFHCNTRHHSIAIGNASQFPGDSRIIHIMLEVLTLDDVGTALELCEKRGVPVPEGLGRHVNDRMVSFYLKTPSGFTIEYGFGAREVDEATWEVRGYDARSIWGHKRADGSAGPAQPLGKPATSHS
jgi:extradiol dioxygenase